MRLKTAAITLTVLAAVAATPAFAASSLAVNPGAALGGTNYGLEVILDGTNTQAYVQDNSPNAEATFTARFRMRIPVSLSMPNATNFKLAYLNNEAGNVTAIWFLVRDAIAQYRFAAWAVDDGGTFRNCGSFFLDFPASPVDRQIEFVWSQADVGMNNGTCGATKVGTAQTFLRSNLDNDTRNIGRIRVGVSDNLNSITGSWNFDEYESFR